MDKCHKPPEKRFFISFSDVDGLVSLSPAPEELEELTVLTDLPDRGVV